MVLETEAGEVIGPVDWSEDDIRWLRENVKVELRGLAIQYGRPLFSMALRVGLINFCISTLAQRLQKNPELSQMVNLLAQAQNDQASLALQNGIGKTMEDLVQCKSAIETVGQMLQGTPAAIAQAKGERVSKGGIILNG